MSISHRYPKHIRVLFVCTGNICRSPMAEAVFRHLIVAAGMSEYISADSAGTGGWHSGEPPHQGTQRVLQQHGISYTHTARQINTDDFMRFDYIIALDSSHLSDIRARAARAGAKSSLLLDYAPATNLRDVPDPYYNGRFAETYALIEPSCRGLLEHIIKTEKL